MSLSDQERIQQLEQQLGQMRRQVELLTRNPAAMRTAARRIEIESLARILNAVCDVCRVNRAQLLGRSRLAHIVDARQMAHTLLYETGLSRNATARYFGCDGSLISHSVSQCQAKLTDPSFRDRWTRVRQLLGEHEGQSADGQPAHAAAA